MDSDSYRASRSAFVLIVASIFAAIGCGKGKQGPNVELTPVSGTVTLDGKPLPGADVAFYLDGTTVEGYYGSGGKTDAQGKYELKSGVALGAAAGSYKVTVSRMVDSNGAPAAANEGAEVGMDPVQLGMQDAYQESVPSDYSDMEKTKLSVTVEKGKTEGYDFQLTSR